MAYVHGKNTVITIDGNDLSAWTKNSELGLTADSHDVTGYGTNSKLYRAGLKDSTLSADGSYQDGATGPRAVLTPLVGGAPVTLIRQPEGAGSGLPQDSVSVIVIDYKETNPHDGYINWSVELQGSGDVDQTAQV